MSTFFGIFQTDLKPVDSDAFGGMESVMNHWRADDSGHFFDTGISIGTLTLHVSPQSLHGSIPFTSGTYTISGDIRLDNREAIVDKLGEERWRDPELSDHVLLLELYKRMGSDSVRHLTGDFAFCIWNASEQSLFCARDHLGVRPFYYYHRDNLFVFSSEKKGILSIPGVDASVNQEFCLLLQADLDTPREQTFFHHIYQLPPATTMTVNRAGVRLQTYWTMKKPPVLRLRDKEEYYEGFREIFQKSVKSRINTNYTVGVELSGGLDSVGVLGAASRMIGNKNNLFSFSNVSLRDEKGIKKLADEEEWIDQAISFNGITNVRKVSTGGWNDIFEALDLELNVHGSPMTYCTTWLEPIRRSMEYESVRVALSGYGGDEFVTNHGENYFYDIFYEQDYMTFFKYRKKFP
jgi:asparagine synthase (glutamine-hydrolysing)